ncbi:hypothetical protein SAMN02745150_00655 [Brevinema andersonii]|uniref:Uncharacterized protein n=1 Tax=Brevinema andersonii TaxID=34097 RepID=A0A1I1DLF5_BREAD|nr:hypothetical protein [Brevinema andersonii]SFB75809.1 hypothetical protein SAMN02745150_00655 [Brevinema andersonii]
MNKKIFTLSGTILLLLTLATCSYIPKNSAPENYNERFLNNIHGRYIQIRPFINQFIAVKSPKNKFFTVSGQGDILYCEQEFAVLEQILSSTEALYRITNGTSYYIKVNPSYSLSGKSFSDSDYQIIAVRNF